MSSNTHAYLDLPKDVAISVRNVTKAYRIYKTPSDRLRQAITRHRKQLYHEVEAVKNVSFELKRGCSMGIVGTNGAGKSTLLQMVAGTLLPTQGEIITRGRVLALLELGSSFNPSFSGRENIFFYGAALGLKYEELQSRYEKIVAFSELENFIDQPIKTYSSGMVMRLAFSVQAHIEPAVLIVDEALSVGDLHFQMKCMRHIKQLLEKGVSLLFVSHGPDAIKRFCDQAIWLREGKVIEIGESGPVVDKYVASIRMEDAEQSRTIVVNEEEESPVEDEIATSTFAPDTSNHPLIEVFDTEDPKWYSSSPSWTNRETTVDGTNQTSLFTSETGLISGFRFLGDHLEIKFLRHQWSGRIRIFVDDQSEVIDLFHNTLSTYKYVLPALEEGEHSVTLLVEEKSNTQSQGSEIWLIGASFKKPESDNYPLLTRLDLDNPQWFSTVPWKRREASFGIQSRTALFQPSPDTTACFSFTGCYLELEFMRHPWSGQIQFQIDNHKQILDLYTPGIQEVYRLRVPGLQQGKHLVEMTVLPSKNTSSQGNEVWFLGATWGKTEVPFRIDNAFIQRSQQSRFGTGEARLTCVELLDKDNIPLVGTIPFGEFVRIRIHAELSIQEPNLHISFIVRDRNQIDIFGSTDFDERIPIQQNSTKFIAEFRFTNTLAPGDYSVHVTLARGHKAEDMTVIEAVDLAQVFSVPFDKDRPVYYTIHVPIEVVQLL